MEELFEGLVPLLIIVLPLLLGKKKKDEKKQSARKQPAKKPGNTQARPSEPLKNTLADVEKKLNAWVESLESEPRPAAAPQPASMEPQYLESEPMVAERLQETGMAEGLSRTDDAGCIGGSLAHDGAAHHQGEDFHPAGAHTVRREIREIPVKVEPVKPAVSASQLRQAVLWKEILDAPVSMRE